MPRAVGTAGLNLDNLFGGFVAEHAQFVGIAVLAMSSQDAAQRGQIGPRCVVIVDVGAAAVCLPRIILGLIAKCDKNIF